MKKRLIAILAFPVITGIFLIGWVMYCFGSKKGSPSKINAKGSTSIERQAGLPADEEIEMGLIEEKPTKQYATQ